MGHKVGKSALPAGHKVGRTAEATLRKARTIATQAINESASVHGDLARNRSTRTRSSYKVKADALDRIARVLNGKE